MRRGRTCYARAIRGGRPEIPQWARLLARNPPIILWDRGWGPSPVGLSIRPPWGGVEVVPRIIGSFHFGHRILSIAGQSWLRGRLVDATASDAVLVDKPTDAAHPEERRLQLCTLLDSATIARCPAVVVGDETGSFYVCDRGHPIQRYSTGSLIAAFFVCALRPNGQRCRCRISPKNIRRCISYFDLQRLGQIYRCAHILVLSLKWIKQHLWVIAFFGTKRITGDAYIRSALGLTCRPPPSASPSS
jgi:hypothetical protein